jgi:hypothetical protein
MRKRVAATAVGLGVALTFGVGGVAFAATSGHPISGTCYEDGSWFISSNVRTMGGSSISASFTTVPSKGLAFGAVNYQTGGQLGHIIYSPPTTNQTIYSGGHSGTQFVNEFKLQSAGHQDNYSFNGSETY